MFTCHDCHEFIATGEAVVRSISFRQISFHRDCWSVRVVLAEVELRALVGSASGVGGRMGA